MIKSEAIKKYFNNVYNIKNSPETTLQLISAEFTQISKELKLGYLKISTSLLSETSKLTDSILFSSEEGYNDSVEPLKKQFLGTNSNYTKFIAYPEKNVTWSEEETSDLIFILQTIFVLIERSHFFSSMVSFQETDVATGAKNLEGLQAIGAMLFEQDELKNYSVLFMNIKNFRFLNHLYGEKNGNYILKLFTMMSKDFISQKGYFGRLGGDNFVALIKSEIVNDYLQFLSSISIPVDSNGTMHNVSIKTRIGISSIPQGLPFLAALTNASSALKVSKESLQNEIVWFEKEIGDKLFQSKKITTSFPKALSNEEILVLYQPKYDLISNTIIGAEALSRWQSDTLLMPQEYISHLESEGLIHNLDLFVLERICIDIKSWEQKGIPTVPVSFNISEMDLYYDYFESDIIKILKKHNVNPNFIEIEIPETHDPKIQTRKKTFIKTVTDFGIKIALDNFGTNTTSLSTLSAYPFTTLKITNEDVNNLLTKKKTNKIFTKALLAITKELNIQVIAQGIESKEHLDKIKTLGCKLGQGFYLNEPLYKIEFENLLATRKTI